MAKKRKRYDDEFRASAKVMLEAAGYPHTLGALMRVAKHLGVPDRTLSRWFHGETNPPPDKLVNKKAFDLRNALREELDGIFAEMVTKREDATYRDLGIVAGILMDKQQLLNNQPTERIEHTGTLTVDERRARVAELLDTARTRRDGSATGGGTIH